ncbi:MAG: 4Fe-4S dicluster domain-containing protein [Verrucomicrobia bacterium]|jgi:ferredoxin-type protein NapG|nr:4Fe-4S dicluster domain-containing protein [Verrucomicrobiota bacterium]MBT7068416.1 4Fe-4S dicluster domain-containing protein [Verrucomicrobiota bacterium]MBT7700235.1 4Fe-4S dicluster domain-containing protein [Verrucomicrobiota bacterium]
MKRVQSTRREFMNNLGVASLATAGVLGLPLLRALPREEGETGIYLRPPGALPHEEFLKRCIRCGACAQACYPDCIRMFDRGPNQDTPYILPRKKACELCMKCVEVCPTGALRKVPAEAVKMGTAVLDKDLCLSHGGRGVCEVCYQCCPRKGKAITQELIRLKPIFHEEHCTGCGMCEEGCPVRKKAVEVIPADASIQKAGLKGLQLENR